MMPDSANASEEADLRVYAVRISPTATAAAVAEFERLAVTAGPNAAENWRDGLLAAWAGLATLPLRCLPALEDAAFQEFRPGPPLRVFLFQQGRRGNVWQILFTAHEETANDPPTVQVHQIRHGAQALLTEWPAEDVE